MVPLSAVFRKTPDPSLRAYPSVARSLDLPLRPWLVTLRRRVLEIARTQLGFTTESSPLKCIRPATVSTAVQSPSTPSAAFDPFTVASPCTIPTAAPCAAPARQTLLRSAPAPLTAGKPASVPTLRHLPPMAPNSLRSSRSALRSVPLFHVLFTPAAAQRHPSVHVEKSPCVPTEAFIKRVSIVDIAVPRQSSPFPTLASRVSTPATVASLALLPCLPLIDLLIWDWPPGLEAHLDKEYVDRKCGIGGQLPVASVEVRDFSFTDGSIFRFYINPACENLLIISVFQYACG